MFPRFLILIRIVILKKKLFSCKMTKEKKISQKISLQKVKCRDLILFSLHLVTLWLLCTWELYEGDKLCCNSFPSFNKKLKSTRFIALIFTYLPFPLFSSSVPFLFVLKADWQGSSTQGLFVPCVVSLISLECDWCLLSLAGGWVLSASRSQGWRTSASTITSVYSVCTVYKCTVPTTDH